MACWHPFFNGFLLFTCRLADRLRLSFLVHGVWSLTIAEVVLCFRRLIRGTMMEVLLPSPSGPEIDNKACPWRVNVVQAENPTNCWGADEDQSGGDPASACALWCTIAMGALVQGQPPEQVRSRSSRSCCRSAETFNGGCHSRSAVNYWMHEKEPGRPLIM